MIEKGYQKKSEKSLKELLEDKSPIEIKLSFGLEGLRLWEEVVDRAVRDLGKK